MGSPGRIEKGILSLPCLINSNVNDSMIVLSWPRTIKKQMSLVVRKPAFCICENKDADQLCGNREADQRLCFRYISSTIPLLPKSEISSL